MTRAVPTSAVTAIATTLAVAALAAAALLAPAALVTGCSESGVVAGASGTKLEHGTTYSADLDGDGSSERVIIDGTPVSLTITDGDTVYRSRDTWQVVEACLGDTDHNGMLEVVALLDSAEGRHLGLFAHFGGEYRERLVTSELDPRPLSLEIVTPDKAPAGSGGSPAATGDLVSLTLEPTPGQSVQQTVLCRWNGFGFTGLGSALPE
ncbi:MAG: hypothetical protein JXA87_07610 [Thermoleophilia bacterium]|nr:hypothetical protein [Thermoleophilia bacterium]